MWIIGDIHGCAKQLDELLAKLPPEEGLIFLGDYIDRGPDSYGVVERLIRERERSLFLMGNHEQMMLSYFARKRDDGWLYPQNGGGATLKSYGLHRDSNFSDLPPSHQDFYQSLSLYFENEAFIAVHAGVRVINTPDMRVQDPEDLLWIRAEWIANESKWEGKHIYYGHTPTRSVSNQGICTPIYGKRSTGIDTGCVYGGCLTAINPESQAIVQVEGIRG
jgi:serine/threonine protein phosphatase 1